MCTSSTGGGSDCGGGKLLLLCSVANFVFDRSLATFVVAAVLHEVVDDANEFVSLLKRGIIIVVDIFSTMHLKLELKSEQVHR